LIRNPHRERTNRLYSKSAFHAASLLVSDIPASKIADVNRGVLLPINRAAGDFKFTIEIDVHSVEGLSAATLENQIKETIRQIGARIQEEAKE
jgi:hypothetical protein